MPLKFPDLNKAKNKIIKDCTVKYHRLCAIAFDSNGNILTYDTNRQITKSTEKTKWTIHAEEFLINKLRKFKARERFDKIYVLVARWRTRDGWGMAKPCENCQNILSSYNVDRVYYTGETGEIERLW